MTIKCAAELNGQYLSTTFRLGFAHRDGLFEGVQSYLAPYLEPVETGAKQSSVRIDAKRLKPNENVPPEMILDQGGSFVRLGKDGALRIYRVTADTPATLAVQDIYCGARRQALQSCPGAVLLHAAAVRIGSRTILFVGSKGAGKSTCLFAAMLGADATLVSSDKLVLYPGPHGTVSCSGLIEGLRVSRDNVAFFGDRFLEAPLVRYWHTAANWASDRLQFGKLTVSPQDAVGLFGTSPALKTRPAAIILLCPDTGKADLIAQSADSQTAGEVREHFLDDVSALERGLPRNDATETAMTRRLLAQCDIYRLTGRPSLSSLLEVIRAAASISRSRGADTQKTDQSF
jgi:hypothetical protein